MGCSKQAAGVGRVGGQAQHWRIVDRRDVDQVALGAGLHATTACGSAVVGREGQALGAGGVVAGVEVCQAACFGAGEQCMQLIGGAAQHQAGGAGRLQGHAIERAA